MNYSTYITLSNELQLNNYKYKLGLVALYQQLNIYNKFNICNSYS